MFEFLYDRERRSRRWPATLLSAGLHGLLVALLVIVPMVWYQVLPGMDLLATLIAPPAPPPTPAPPAPQPDRQRTSNAEPVRQEAWTAPDRIPDLIPPPDSEPPQVGIPPGLIGTTMGFPAGSGLAGGNVVQSLLAIASSPPPPPPPAPKPKPLPVGGVVQESKLLRRVVPEYPPIARRNYVEGMVLLSISVDEEGNVSDVRVLQGHPLLVDEAVRAVRQWKYSPTLLNGEPIPVISTVSVIFKLK